MGVVRKLLTSGYFWTVVAALAISIWIYNASPNNLEKFSKIINQDPSFLTSRGDSQYRIRRPRGKKRGRRKNVYEEKCREIFEKIFRANFPSTRKITWLKNPETGKPLELDGYNPDLVTPIGRGLAFEYDGIQHAAPNAHFHGKNADREFSSQFRRDEYKTDLCKKHKVLLIRIHHAVDYDQLEPFIRKKLTSAGFSFDGTKVRVSKKSKN